MGRPSLLILENQIYANLKTIKKVSGRYWLCECVCGIFKNIQSSHLFNGRIKSCGCLLRSTKLPKGTAGFNRLLTTYKNNAKKRNLVFELTVEEFKTLTNLDCHYCGNTPNQISCDDNKTESSKYVYNGVDRKKNDLGYNFNNCVACCGTCNTRKMGMGYEAFLTWIKKCHKHLEKKNADQC